MAVTGRTNLSLKQAFAVRDWLLKNQAELKAEQFTVSKAADQITKEIGFAVTESQLTRCAKECDLFWIQRQKGAKAGEVFRNKIREMEHAISRLKEELLATREYAEAQLAVHRGLVVTLANKVGLALPAAFVASNAEKTAVVTRSPNAPKVP